MEQIKKYQILALALTVCLAVSLFFNVYPLFSGSNVGAKTFVYEWAYGPLVVLGEQQIVNETLRLELTIEWKEETLSIIAKINDNDYNIRDILGLVFDRNGNGVIDVGLEDSPYMLFACNLTYYHDVALCKDGTIRCIIDLGPEDSVYHTCTFKEAIGYTFDIHIPKTQLSNVKADMLYITFQDREYHPPSISEKAYWVAVTFGGWQ